MQSRFSFALYVSNINRVGKVCEAVALFPGCILVVHSRGEVHRLERLAAYSECDVGEGEEYSIYNIQRT